MLAKVIGSRRKQDIIQLVVRRLDDDAILVLDVCEETALMLLSADLIQLCPVSHMPHPSDN